MESVVFTLNDHLLIITLQYEHTGLHYSLRDENGDKFNKILKTSHPIKTLNAMIYPQYRSGDNTLSPNHHMKPLERLT